MRRLTLISSLLFTSFLTGCGLAGLAGSEDGAGPPDWFLREHERAQLAAARAAAAAQGGLRFTVATDLTPGAFGGRLAEQIETCWLGGEPGWRLARGEGDLRLSMMETPATPELENAAADPNRKTDRVALSFMVDKPGGPGVLVTAHGPLAGEKNRGRIRNALERAKRSDAGAPFCVTQTQE